MLLTLEELSEVNDQVSTHYLYYGTRPPSYLQGMLNVYTVYLYMRM
jgi:hypothetical protein